MNPLVAYGLITLITEIFQALRDNSNNRYAAARSITELGVPPRETDLIMRLVAPRYSQPETAAMTELLSLTKRVLQQDTQILKDAYTDSVRSALTNGFVTLIPNLIVALPASLSTQYYAKTTNEKVALASEIASAFTDRWPTFSQNGKTRLLALLGQPATLATRPTTTTTTGTPGTGNPTTATGGTGGGSTGGGGTGGGGAGGGASAPTGAKTPPGAKTPANPSVGANSINRTSETPPTPGARWDPESGMWMSAEEYQAWKELGYYLDEKGDWQEAAPGSVYDPAIDGYWSKEEMDAFRADGWVLNSEGAWIHDVTLETMILDPDSGDYMTRTEYREWQELGWTIKTDPIDGRQYWIFDEPLDGADIYDPDTGQIMSGAEYQEWQSQGWRLNEDGTDWVFDASIADFIVDPDTGLSMSLEEYDYWMDQGWFIDEFGSWSLFDLTGDDDDDGDGDHWDGWWDDDDWSDEPWSSSGGDEDAVAVESGTGEDLPLFVEGAPTAVSHVGNQLALTEDRFHPLVAGLPVGQLRTTVALLEGRHDPMLDSLDSAALAARIRAHFEGTDGQFDEEGYIAMAQSLLNAPQVDWKAIEAGAALGRQAALEREQYEAEMAAIGWNISDDGAWTWDQSVEDARIERIYESVGLVRSEDGTWGFGDTQRVRSARPRARRVPRDASSRVLHDANCLCDACVGTRSDGQFDIPSSLPLGTFHRSAWMDCALADWGAGDYGEVIIDFEKTPFEVTLNRNVAPARREASLIHEALHIGDEWYKTNMSHDNLHAMSTFIGKVILPAVEALREVESAQ